ncbi:hypothetical protein M413DRAFT_13950 [Hebeloma cylindrosporum]|uniref:Chromatin modification-related protein n=1 Tax=Hebeloma cylindrosporum TaxID=76867 RepID=A0A0C3BWI4_HEBCY|nr:hypothetical protein M413DRAFT_13950 [Hebeloma cylindrosporum h7]
MIPPIFRHAKKSRGLDNLPSEVQHLLQEIKIKELRCQDLQQDIAKDQSKYIKAAIKHSSTPSTPSSTGQANSRTASPAPVAADPRSKAHLPARIAASYAEIDTLTNEKVVLAQRIIELVTRTRARLDADLAKVRLLQGESPEDARGGVYLSAGTPIRSSSPYTGSMKREGSVAGLNPVVQIGESLRSAMAGGVETPVSAAGPGYNKKRRLTTTTSIKLPSPIPANVTHQSTATHTRSRLSRSTRIQQQEEEEQDADAEGDEDVEGDDGEDDDSRLYCFCHKQSFGDMIGCDNEDCPYQWFHIECVGVKTPLPDKWYCPECINIVKPPAEKRKGRKK